MLRKRGLVSVAGIVAFALIPIVRAADNPRILKPMGVMPDVRDYGFL